jgi:hypothetical protein
MTIIDRLTPIISSLRVKPARRPGGFFSRPLLEGFTVKFAQVGLALRAGLSRRISVEIRFESVRSDTKWWTATSGRRLAASAGKTRPEVAFHHQLIPICLQIELNAAAGLQVHSSVPQKGATMEVTLPVRGDVREAAAGINPARSAVQAKEPAAT